MKYTNFTIDHISPAPAGGDVAWVNQVNTSTAATTIYKTGGQAGVEDAGATSQQSVASGNASLQHAGESIPYVSAAVCLACTLLLSVGFQVTETHEPA